MSHLCLFIHVCISNQVRKGLPTAEEAYNFFTFNFEPDPQDQNEKQRKNGAGTEKDDEEDGEEPGGANVDEVHQDRNETQV